MFELTIEDTFDSAHNLREYHGACERVHGHTYRVQVALRAEATNSEGMVRDFKEIKEALKTITDRLDHMHLNVVPPFDKLNPTAENIARYIYFEMRAALGESIYRATVWETPGSSASYWED